MSSGKSKQQNMHFEELLAEVKSNGNKTKEVLKELQEIKTFQQFLSDQYDRVPTQFSKPNSMTFHDFSMTFPWPLLHFFHACLSDTYTCKLVTVLLKIADVALKGSNSNKLAPCVVAVSHLKTKPTLLSISTSYLHCQI